jgi:actin-related protein
VLQEKIENRRSAITEKAEAEREKIRAKQQAQREKDIAQREKDNEKFLADQQKFYDEQNALAEKQELFVESRRAAAAENEKKRIQESMALAAKQLDQKIEGFASEAAERKRLNDAIAQLESEKLAVFNEGTASVISLLAADEAARKKNATAIKFFESGRVAVNGLAEISEIAKTFAALGPVGQILAAARIAFSGIRTAAAIKRINSQKFEYGGSVLRGPRHSQGGIPIEAEGGEIIMTRGVYSNPALRRAASAINVAGGGRQFAAGGPVNPISTGRAPIPSGRAGDASALFDMNALASLLDQKMDQKIYRIQVNNNLQETDKGLGVLNQLKSEADV